MPELLIVIAVVAAASVFVTLRWVRSAKRVLRPPPGTVPGCGGTCEGCRIRPEQMPSSKDECPDRSAPLPRETPPK